MENKLYDINNIYTGILNLESNLTNYDKNLHNKKWQLINNGAVDLTYSFVDSTNIPYRSIFTLFKKINDKYLCLHNAKLYDFEGKDYIENLKSFRESVPKIDFNVSEKLSLNKINSIFNTIYNDYKSINLYNKDLHLFNDFYIGQLHILNNINKQSVKHNIIDNKLLLHDEYVGNYEKIENNNKYEYNIVNCLFLKINDKFYCLNNFKFYDDKRIIGKDFCQNIIPLKEYGDYNIFTNIDKISIESAHDLYCGQKNILNKKRFRR